MGNDFLFSFNIGNTVIKAFERAAEKSPLWDIYCTVVAEYFYIYPAQVVRERVKKVPVVFEADGELPDDEACKRIVADLSRLFGEN